MAAARKLSLTWTDEDTLEARFPIDKEGIYLGAVETGQGKVLPLAPLSLPYSPEFEPRPDPNEGRKTLEEIARVSGGAERTSWDDVFNASRLRDRQSQSRHFEEFALDPSSQQCRGVIERAVCVYPFVNRNTVAGRELPHLGFHRPVLQRIKCRARHREYRQ